MADEQSTREDFFSAPSLPLHLLFTYRWRNHATWNVHMNWNSSFSFMYRFPRLFHSVCYYCFDSLATQWKIGNKLLTILHFENGFVALTSGHTSESFPCHFTNKSTKMRTITNDMFSAYFAECNRHMNYYATSSIQISFCSRSVGKINLFVEKHYFFGTLYHSWNAFPFVNSTFQSEFLGFMVVG